MLPNPHPRWIAAILAASIFTASGSAQEPTAPSTSAPQTTELTFALERGRMTVPVVVAGQGPFDFLIDTGAERSVVSHELAGRLNLRPGDAMRVFDFVGPSDVATVHIPALAVSNLGGQAIEAPALAMANLGALGMLGIDALQGHRLAIDFARRRMEVRPSTRRVRGELIVSTQQRVGQLIITAASFQGQPIAVVIDTGSWVSIGNSAMLALAKQPPRRLGPISVTSVTGRSFDAELMVVSDLKIGDVRFDNVGLSFADVAPFERFGLRDKPALILGMSSLRLFRRIEMDFANREIGFSLPVPPIDFHNVCRSISSCRSYR
ncbi:aspartyl protease family protein [Sphingomonas cannabina]|uniref:aspartyl protease family protein n=1 Tax=Sphingomonas cannabina TaxID=2899123 RepID=UPI001F1A3CC5|nr:aspartyl protease family protein [Sphingomonas cannabina]UIJ45993.1 aspartyl protease family protein [Sphingomonas cannabina]